MADIGVFPSSLADDLAAPTVCVIPLAVFQFGDGAGGTVTRRFHTGVGTLTIEGVNYEGVTDPGQTRMVSLDFIELPTPQTAPKVDITLTGVDAAFLSTLRSQIGEIYGRPAEIYMAVINPETYQVVGSPVLVFDHGICGMPRFFADSVGTRAITLPIDGIWSSKNNAPGGRLNDADQKLRYPGDRGFELVGGVAEERIK